MDEKVVEESWLSYGMRIISNGIVIMRSLKVQVGQAEMVLMDAKCEYYGYLFLVLKWCLRKLTISQWNISQWEVSNNADKYHRKLHNAIH
jgi:hypothetical protein